MSETQKLQNLLTQANSLLCTWSEMAKKAAIQDEVEYVGVNTIFAVSDTLRAQRDAIAGEAGRLREALECVPLDLINAIEDGNAPVKLFLSVGSCKLIGAALSTPTTDAWLAERIAAAVKETERKYIEAIKHGEREEAALNRICAEYGQCSVDRDAAVERAQAAEAQVAALREVIQTAKYDWAFISTRGHGSYDWNADPLYLTRAEGEVYGRLANAITQTAATASRYKARVRAEVLNDPELQTRLAAADAIEAGWQPIETAPKDKEIWLYGPSSDGGSYQECCGWWTSKVSGIEGRWPVVFMHGYLPPTHWRPLPAPPEARP